MNPKTITVDVYMWPMKSWVLCSMAVLLIGCRLETIVEGQGTITSDDLKIDCDGSPSSYCDAEYDSATSVTLTAAPSNGWVFSHWGGANPYEYACHGKTGPICSIDINAETAEDPNAVGYLQAVFVPDPLALTQPLDGEVFSQTDPVPLSATAYDSCSGASLSSQVVFRSDIDGKIVDGGTLTPGWHRITASVQDCQSGPTEVHAEVLVTSGSVQHLPVKHTITGIRRATGASWDGRVRLRTGRKCYRVFESTHYDGSLACTTAGGYQGFKVPFWEVFLFRPEALQPGMSLNDNTLYDSRLGSETDYPHVRLGVDHDPYIDDSGLAVASPSDTEGRTHQYSVYANSAFPRNPYRSDASGSEDDNGAYETYQLTIISKMNCTNDSSRMVTDPGSGVKYCNGVILPTDNILAMLDVQVVIQNPRTSSAQIYSTSTSTGHALKNTDGELVVGFEPTVTADGRLIVWHSRTPVSSRNGFLSYTFNDSPNDPLDWTPQQPVSNLYYKHGPGRAGGEYSLPSGIKFSDQYPLAKKPLLTANGEVFVEDEHFPGAYPWMSFDGSELAFSVVPNFKAKKRSGFSMVGALTNWTTQHIDAAANVARGNVRPNLNAGIDISGLNALYFGKYGYSFERLFSAPFGLSNTMWDLEASNPHPVLPYSGREFVYSLQLSGSGDYVEIPLDTFSDGHYIVYWPMNELLNYDRAELGLEAQVLPEADYLQHKNSGVQYDPKKTPDVSGNHWNGILSAGSSAQFPFEKNGASLIWNETTGQVTSNDPADLKDEMSGIKGNAIFFQNDGFVTSSSAANMNAGDLAAISAQIQSISDAGSFTIEFWLKPDAFVGECTLLEVKELVEVKMRSNYPLSALGFIRVSVLGNVNTAVESDAQTIDHDVWNHVAVVVKNGWVSIFINGSAKRAKRLEADVYEDGIPDLSDFIKLGCFESSPGSAWIDEFAFSNVARSLKEIRTAAYWKDETEPTTSFGAVPPEFSGLEQYVSDKRLGSAVLNDVIQLGADLFESPILSRQGNATTCATCHEETNGFADDAQFSQGAGPGTTSRNSPSILNRLFASNHMLDGRAGSLEAQSILPMMSEIELDQPIEEAVTRILNDVSPPSTTNFGPRFQSVFGEPANRENLLFSLASYVRSLVIVPDPPVVENHPGKALFEGKARCISCHNGPNFTDESFHNVGVGIAGDPGLGALTNRSADLGKFKTPTLWGVRHTGPYFHDGRFGTLGDVIDFYSDASHPQRSSDNLDFRIKPLGLTASEKQDLESYLISLDGTMP